MTYGGDHIPKSPFNVAVAPTVDLSKINITGLGDSTYNPVAFRSLVEHSVPELKSFFSFFPGYSVKMILFYSCPVPFLLFVWKLTAAKKRKKKMKYT